MKLVDRVHSGDSGGLYVARLGSRGLNSFSPTLECDNRPSLGEFRFELGDDEVSSKETDARNDDDAEFLGTRV
jgi:hypothetical protein